MILMGRDYWLENSEKAPGDVGIGMNLGGEEGIVGSERDGHWGWGVCMKRLPPPCPPGHLAPDVGGFWHLVAQASTVVQTSSSQTLRSGSVTHLPWSCVLFWTLLDAQYMLIP